MKRFSGSNSQSCARSFRSTRARGRHRLSVRSTDPDDPRGRDAGGDSIDEDGEHAATQIQDVAEHAGVSVSAVSNVLSGRTDMMLPSTFHRVNDSIRLLEYRPKPLESTRLLKVGHARMLCLLVPSIANPFFGSLARELDQVAKRRGYHLLLGNTYRDPEIERELLEGLVASGVRGVITASSIAEQGHYMSLIDRGLTIVSFDRKASPDLALPIDYVSIDNFHAGYAATQHLIENGHRSIAYVTAPARTMSRLDRRAGYLAAMKEAGMTRLVRVIEQAVESGAAEPGFADSEMAQVGRAAANELASKRRRPTALVAMTDMVAIGLIAGLHDSGLRVPNDMSIVGIDDLYLDALVSPALSSMRQPLPDIAEETISRILERLANPALATTERLFKPLLMGRDSVRAHAPGGRASKKQR